jgi:hypothetical protein
MDDPLLLWRNFIECTICIIYQNIRHDVITIQTHGSYIITYPYLHNWYDHCTLTAPNINLLTCSALPKLALVSSRGQIFKIECIGPGHDPTFPPSYITMWWTFVFIPSFSESAYRAEKQNMYRTRYSRFLVWGICACGEYRQNRHEVLVTWMHCNANKPHKDHCPSPQPFSMMFFFCNVYKVQNYFY